MTSTVSGTLRPGLRYYDIFRGLFPSGSITGAPKIRTMQIIRELERAPRGVYTGAIGYIAPAGRPHSTSRSVRLPCRKDGPLWASAVASWPTQTQPPNTRNAS